MRSTLIALALFTFLLMTDVHANSSQVGEATEAVTGVMREVFAVLVEFFGAILDEIVRAVKEIF